MEPAKLPWKSELWFLMKLGLPYLLSQLLFEAALQISVVFSATISEVMMTEAGLAFAMFYATAGSVANGFTFASDPMLAQSYGSDKKQVGAVFQRGLLLSTIVLSLNLPVLLLSGWAVAFVSATEDMMVQSTRFLHVSMITLSAMMFNMQISRLLMLQRRIWELVVINIILNGICIGLHIAFIHGLKLGVFGAGLATGCAFWLTNIIIVLYIWKRGYGDEIWDGWKSAAWLHWGTYAKLLVNGISLSLLVFMLFDGFVYLTGILSPEELSTQVVAAQVYHLFSRLWQTLCVIGALRIGELLGTGDLILLRLSLKILVIVGTIGGVFMASVILLLDNQIVEFMLDEPVTRQIGRKAIKLVALTMIVQFPNNTMRGIMFAAGKHRIVAIANTIVFIFILTPLTLTLMFSTPLRSYGFLTGHVCGIAVVDIIALIYIYRLDWEHEAIIVKERLLLERDNSTGNIELIKKKRNSEEDEEKLLQKVSKSVVAYNALEIKQDRSCQNNIDDKFKEIHNNCVEYTSFIDDKMEDGTTDQNIQTLETDIGRIVSRTPHAQSMNGHNEDTLERAVETFPKEFTLTWFLRHRLPILAASGSVLLTAVLLSMYYPPQYALARNWFIQHVGNYSMH